MGSVIRGDRIMSCHYCQREVGPGRLTFTRDHVVPRALGGLDVRWNVVASCRDCNGDKADKYPKCTCSFCRKAKRLHWEKFQINAWTKPKRLRAAG